MCADCTYELIMSSGDSFWSTDAEVETDCGLTKFLFQILHLIQFDLSEEIQAVNQTVDSYPAVKSAAVTVS